MASFCFVFASRGLLSLTVCLFIISKVRVWSGNEESLSTVASISVREIVSCFLGPWPCVSRQVSPFFCVVLCLILISASPAASSVWNLSSPLCWFPQLSNQFSSFFLRLPSHIQFPKILSAHCLKTAMLQWWKWLQQFWEKKILT